MKKEAKAARAAKMAAVWGERCIRFGILAQYGEAIGNPYQAYWRARLAFRAAAKVAR